MNMTISHREFRRHVSAAKRAAINEPVFITVNDRPTHVLMSFEEYQRLTKQRRNIADVLAMSDVCDIEFEPKRAFIKVRPADLS